VNIYNIMPWYNGKFFFDKDKINMSEQRFNALPTQSLTSDDLLVFNNSTNEVNSRPVASIGAVGPTGPTGDTLNSSNWLWGSSNFSAFTSGQFTSFDSVSSSNSLSNTTTIEINPVDRNGNIIGTGPSTSVGNYIATGWFGLFNTGDVLTVQYTENNYATYRLTKQPEWVVSSTYPPIIRLSVEFVNNGSASSTFTILEYGIGLVNGGMNAGLDYNFDEETITPAGSPISFGSIRLNNANQSASTVAYLSVEVANGNVVGNFINSWNSFGNNPGTRGFLQFKTNHNHDFLTFDVTNVSFTTTGGPHYIIQLTNGIGAIGTPYINNELVSVNFIPAGTDGGSGGSGPINSTVSFFSDYCKIPGGGLYNIQPFTLDVTNSIIGVPILPHGSGAFASASGSAMQIPTGFISNASIWTYGAYMPQPGEIYCAAINYNYTNPTSGGSGRILAMNYTTGGADTILTIGPPPTAGSANQTFSPTIAINQGDYIGIAIQNQGGTADEIVVEGTLFLKLT